MTSLNLRKFDMSKIAKNSVVVMIGKRNTGKSFLTKDLLFLFFSVNGDFFYRSGAQNYSQCDHLRINYNWHWIKFYLHGIPNCIDLQYIGPRHWSRDHFSNHISV